MTTFRDDSLALTWWLPCSSAASPSWFQQSLSSSARAASSAIYRREQPEVRVANTHTHTMLPHAPSKHTHYEGAMFKRSSNLHFDVASRTPDAHTHCPRTHTDAHARTSMSPHAHLTHTHAS